MAVAAPVNYDQLLAEDKSYQAILAGIAQGEAADRQALIATGQSLAIPYGEVPTFASSDEEAARTGGFGGPSVFNDIFDPLTRTLAGEATQAGVSTVARDLHDRNENYANMKGALAGRGQIRSGAFGVHTSAVAHDYAAQRFSDLTAFLNALGQGYNNYLTALAGRRTERASANSDALARLIATIQANGAPGAETGDTTPDPVWPAGGSGPTYPGEPTTIPDYGGTPTAKIPDTYVQGSAGQGSEYADLPPFYPGTTVDVPGGQETDFTPAAQAAISAAPNYLDTHSTPERDVYVPVSKPAAPTVPGYGGGRTSGQVRRNNL